MLIAPSGPRRAGARFAMNAGGRSSNNPNMLSAITAKKRQIAPITHGFWKTKPNDLPLSAATRPRVEYIRAMPRT